jgi:multisubunit Na+/H+ antiporter MnhG subunit
VIALALVWAGVVLALACCAGLLAMRDAIDKLHFTSAASVLPPILVCGGVVVDQGLGAVGLTAILVAVVLVLAGPAAIVAIARLERQT